MIQKETFKQWFIETSKPDSQKDKRLILSLVAELRANNQHLTSLGIVTPIIGTIKNLIDNNNKEKISSDATSSSSSSSAISSNNNCNSNMMYYDELEESC
jgi:hypothetical protein